jgi:mycothiol synthase
VNAANERLAQHPWAHRDNLFLRQSGLDAINLNQMLRSAPAVLASPPRVAALNHKSPADSGVLVSPLVRCAGCEQGLASDRELEGCQVRKLTFGGANSLDNYRGASIAMEPASIDERQLPAMYMVWPILRLPVAPAPAIPDGYAVDRCFDRDLSAVRAVIDSDEPVSDQAWDSFRDHILPGGAFLIVEASGGRPVATASASHNPRATRHYFPFGGEIGYVAVDPLYRGKGLGRAVVALAVARLIEAGYHHIFVGVQGWRLPAVKCYLGLGFVPLLHTDELLPRWRRICEQIKWPNQEAEWPRSLASVA